LLIDIFDMRLMGIVLSKMVAPAIMAPIISSMDGEK
jgi:hypothetical protein